MATYSISTTNFSGTITDAAFTSTDDPASFSYVHPGGDLYVFVNYRSNSLDISSITFDGDALSVVVNSGQGGTNPGSTSQVWYRANVAAKTATLAVDYSGAPVSAGYYMVAISGTTLDSSGSTASAATDTPTVTHTRVASVTLTVYCGARNKGAASLTWTPNDSMSEGFDEQGAASTTSHTICVLEESSAGSIARSSTGSSSGKASGTCISLALVAAGQPAVKRMGGVPFASPNRGVW